MGRDEAQRMTVQTRAGGSRLVDEHGEPVEAAAVHAPFEAPAPEADNDEE